jgi:Fe-S-cluster containining protein
MGEARRTRAGGTGTPDDPVFQRELFRQSFAQTCKLLDDPRVDDVRALILTTRGRNQKLDEDVETCARAGGAECAPGCSSCCYLLVSITPFEAFAIARHLLETRTPADLARITERLKALAEVPVDPRHRHDAQIPCALLESDRCSIYEHRPSMCRTALSQSRAACESCRAKGSGVVPSIEQPSQIDTLMQMGIDYALISRRNLSTERVEFSRAVLVALRDPQALSAWLEGKDPFPDAHVRSPGQPSAPELATAAARRFGIA